MNNFLQQEQQRLDAENLGYALVLGRDPKSLGLPIPRKPAQSTQPTPLPPPTGTEMFIRSCDTECEDCYGTGRDFYHPGHPQDASDCAACGGIGRRIVTRNYLSESFAIAANPESTRTIEREHLICLIQYARMFVSAAISMPDVKLPEVAA
jgi:hypothetical protein